MEGRNKKTIKDLPKVERPREAQKNFLIPNSWLYSYVQERKEKML